MKNFNYLKRITKSILLLAIVTLILGNPAKISAQYECGAVWPPHADYDNLVAACACPPVVINEGPGEGWYCCGEVQDGQCVAPGEDPDPPEDPGDPGDPPADPGDPPADPGDPPEGNSGGGVNVYEAPTNAVFDQLNPLLSPFIGGNPEVGSELTTPGGVLSRVLDYALPLAGMILFVMILWGGFEILAGSAGKKSLDAGKQRITAAIVGFILLFASYWIIQVIEVIFGIAIV